MPKLNGTGPTGKGPMTGKGGGSCIIPLNTKEQEIDYLKNREKALKLELAKTEKRINKLNTKVHKE
jgi:mevalonate kinase